MGDQDAASSVFDGCSLFFVKSRDLSETLIQELSGSVERFGGKVINTNRKKTPPITEATHIIANTIDFPQYGEAASLMLPVVRSGWIQASIERSKQLSLRQFSPDPRMIFSDVVLSCADIPPTDKEAIVGATMAMGGTDSDNVTRLVTHICALSMDHPKCQTAVEKKLKCKIVLPHWFDDCFRLGKKIDEKPYELPNPEILLVEPDEAVAVPPNQHLEGATSAVPTHMPIPSASAVEGGRPAATIFKDRNVMLSQDLSISARLKIIVGQLIKEGGGAVTDNVEECDMFICQYREGKEYVEASHANKDVGNLSWLYHLIHTNEWTSPKRRLLHYPVPRECIPGFKDLRITLSNYGGDARIYLENLIVACGATYTKTMKADNSHLITARDNSEKCDAARDWNINMINHLWIEESYAKCQLQSLTVGKYTHFPPRTNLGEIIGTTPFDEAKLQDQYYPREIEDKPPSPTATKKRKLGNITNESTSGPSGPSKKNFDVMRDDDADVFSALLVAPKRGTAKQPMATPAKGRHVRVGKENETPSTVGSSRSAKEKARDRLSEIAPDIALYEKEKKRHKDGQGPWGGKRAADLIEKELHKQQPVLSSPSGPKTDEETSLQMRPAKRARPNLVDIEMRVILTGFKRWVDEKFREDADRKKLRSLGIAVVQDGQQCDYLIAPQLVRTVKFLRNLSKGATILSSEFIEVCLDTGKVPAPEKYRLKDTENEKKLGINLATSTRRALTNNSRLLFGVPIYCTSMIKNGTESYKAIAEANGAYFQPYSARSGTTIKPSKPEDRDQDASQDPDPVYLLSTDSAEEKKLWSRFENMARRGNMEPRVVAPDWLLDIAMQQEFVFDKKYCAKDFFGS